jgi:hypothetical protein
MVFAVVAASLLAEPYLIGYHKGMAANEIRGYNPVAGLGCGSWTFSE